MKRLLAFVGSTVLALSASALFVGAQVADVPSGTWAPASEMSAARAGASAAQLADGRVLITGGLSGDIDSPSVLQTAEVFGLNGVFTPASPMGTPRAHHASVRLKDGRVLVTGGETANEAKSKSAEIYDPATNAWSDAGEMLEARSGHTMSLLKSGRVLIAGGGSLETYDPESGLFSFAGALSPSRTGHAAAVMLDGRVVLAGGQSDAGALTAIDVYEDGVGVMALGDLETARTDLSATTMLDGRVLFAGGHNASGDLDSVEIYDPSFSSMVGTSASLGVARSGHLAFLLPSNNHVLILGGTSDGATLSSVEMYEPWSDSVRSTRSMESARSGAVGSALSQDGLLLAAGGLNASGLQASAELYGFPTIKTDADDYAPGTVVVIAGSGWKPGETVHLQLKEVPQLDEHLLPDAVADTNGDFQTADFAPDEGDLDIRFYLTARGEESLLEAQNTFTDGAVRVKAVGPSSIGVDWVRYNTTNCSGPAAASGTISAVSAGSGTDIPSGPAVGESLRLTGLAVAGFSFQSWSSGGLSPSPDSSNPICVPHQNGTRNIDLTYVVATATTTTVASSSNPSTYGDSVTFTATVARASGSPSPTGTVQFKIDSVNFGSPVALSSLNATTSTATSAAISTLSGGTHTVTADYIPTGSFSASSGTLSGGQVVNPAAQTITVTTPAPATAVYNTTFNVAATASSGLNVAITATGVCTVQSGGTSSATILMTSGTGTCTVHYNQLGNGNYNAAPEVTQNVTAQKAAQTITVTTPAPATAGYNTTFNVAATASSGLNVAITATGVCTVQSGGTSSATILMTSGTGTCTVHYTQAGDANYSAAPEVTNDVAAQKAAQTITVTTPAPATAGYNTTFNVAATASSGLNVAITVTGVCTVQSGGTSSATILMTSGTGTCTVHYNQAGDGSYSAAPEVTQNVTAQKAAQTITVTTPAPATAAYNTTFSVAATASSGLDVTITASGVCTVQSGGSNSATILMTSGTGTCTVHYTQAGDSNYDPAPEKTNDVTAQKAAQTITVTTPAPATAVYNTTFNVAATASSGLDVTITASGVCTVQSGGSNSATILMTSGTGTCTVHYTQAGDANYDPAPEKTNDVTAQKAAQTITVTTPAPATAVYNTTFNVAATASSGLDVAITASGVCTVQSGGTNSATILMTSGTGTCTVHYTQAGDANYDPAPEKTNDVTAQKAAQTITVTTPAPVSAIYNTTFNVAATASSGLDVTITASGVCTVQSGGSNSATILMTSGTGTCTVHYTQAGDSNYDPAPEKTNDVTAQKAAQTITVTTPAPATAVYNTTFNVAATASSGLDVTITASGVCTVQSGGSNSATILMTSGTGTCTVHYTQAGDSNYDPAPEKTNDVTAQKAAQTITVTTPAPATAVYNTTFNVAATASSGLDVTITASGVCTVQSGGSNSATILMTSGTGTCTVHYTQAGDANYDPAPEKTNDVTAQKAAQTITVTTPAPATAVYNTTFNVAATASSGLDVAITASGVCTVQSGGTNSATILMTSGTGTCTVHYTQAGDANYDPAPEKTNDVTAQKAAQTITVTTPAPATAVYNTTFNVAATASSGLDVTITASGVCTVQSGGSNSATILMTSGTGTCTVHYTQAGDANYDPAPEKTNDVTAQKAAQTITVTTPAPVSAIYNTTFNVAATASSGLDVAITASGVCTVQSGGTNSATILMTSGTGTCTVHYNQAGDTNYSAAPEVTQGVTAQKVALMITASSHSIIFGSPVPTIAPGYSGFVGGDSASNLTTQPNCSTTYIVGSLIGPYPSSCAGAASGNYSFTYADGTVTVTTACSVFNGFLSPIGGSVEAGTGGSFANPVRSFKLNSTIPVKFNATCSGAPLTTGVHTLQAIKASNATTWDSPIDATPTDAATDGNQFRLTGTEWHFNLNTKVLGANGQGIWLFKATLYDGSSYSVWIEIKK